MLLLKTVQKVESIVIMAAKPKKWLIEFLFDGELLLDRTIRQIKNRCNKIWVTCSFEGQHGLQNEVVNTFNGHDLGCMYGVKHLNADLFLFGDVYFTDNAINLIINGNSNFYGRSTGNLSKHYGEMFAIKPSDKLWQDLNIMWEQYTSSKIPRLWSWDLYGRMQGASYYEKGITGNWTEINDATDDFDYEVDVTNWSKAYNILVTPNFDEEFYLNKHSDVKQHIPAWFPSGYAHYVKFGAKEGREKRRLK